MYESLNLQLPSPVTQLHDALLTEKQIQLYIKRDDLIHPYIQGNKWRKLKHNIIAAQSQNLNTLLTFGGAYSNHIHATAAAGYYLGLQTIGIIRGEQTLPLNPTLLDATNWGMTIDYVNRSQYRHKNDPEFINTLKQKFGDFFLIPEGGSNIHALKGCAEIIDELESSYDYICSACGTGATLAGIIQSPANHSQTLGFAILKSKDQIENDIKHLLSKDITKKNNWLINKDYHFGGYAKTTDSLMSFITNFYTKHTIQLEPVYTGKMMYGLFDLIKNNYFEPGSRILAIHTGGLQGLRGFSQ
ncbi:MAG: pyridoxal-phosphate dependent enzyme [Gammaproteobacteria bacterium]|nr:pyridoxal-phosphate dependent enzyme [Gammaproteobacteria bacterium]